ncbi:9302_t:CDS:1 [Scutellospora calospora]|uniref:9302_t:CDS:1 n=1 Tax=Scutellospora calospora TaxID=85575 RepID=A0ACA9JWV0_9GLOM|nr:9302_t:CDS:1 [Scutellospora calospora]
MVNAKEWLNEKIPVNQRAKAISLYIYKQCQSGHTVYQNNCNYCASKNNIYAAPNFLFYNTTLEGELDLKDFVNLQQLYICGTGQDQNQQQKLTRLWIDKCNKLNRLQIKFNNTTFYDLFVREKIFNYNLLIRGLKRAHLDDLELEKKKLEEKKVVNQLANKVNEDNQLWLEFLLETQQEVLQNDNAFARKQLKKVEERLSKELTAKEIQNLLGKKLENYKLIK